MPFILLFSADRTLDNAIRAGLPRGISLQVDNLVPSDLSLEKLDTPGKPILILVDAGIKPDATSWLPRLGQIGLPMVAIISNPSERESLFLAGIKDYLLQPLMPEEIKARLSAYLPQVVRDGDIRRTQGESIPGFDDQKSLIDQIIQNERWITIGRLIACISHDITNQMQATQGALSLAAEEHALSDNMRAYLSICQQGMWRVSMQVERLRHIYHPATDQVAMIDIVVLLDEVVALASDVMTTRGVTFEMSLATDLPIIRGRAGQLQFVLLGLLLNLIDLISSEIGGSIGVEARTVGPTIQIGFSTDAPLSVISNQRKTTESEPPAHIIEYALGLPTLRRVILAQNGDIGLLWNDPGLSVWISLPIA